MGLTPSRVNPSGSIYDLHNRKRPKHTHIKRDQATYSTNPQVHHVKINSQNQLVILGYTNHRVDNLMFSSHIYLIKKVIFYYDHFIVLTEAGTVWVCGENTIEKDTYGRIGLGDSPRTDFVVQLDVPLMKDIMSNGTMCFLITETSETYIMGKDTYRVSNSTKCFKIPTLIPSLRDIENIVFGDYLYILDSQGTVTLYNGSSLPQVVTKNATHITCEKKLAIVWGEHNIQCYDAGLPQLETIQPVEKHKITSISSCAGATFCTYDMPEHNLVISGNLDSVKQRQEYYAIYADDFLFKPVEALENKFISQVTCGKNHAIFVQRSGHETVLYGVGSNFSGQLGQPTTVEEVHEPIEIKWRNMFPDGMSYFSTWHIQSVGCSQHNTYIWLSK
jgi:alpha-tubulin suppressor-like RCC1 family protein